MPGTRHLVPGTRYLVPCTWHQVPGALYRVPGTRYQVPGTRYQAPGPRFRRGRDTASSPLSSPQFPPNPPEMIQFRPQRFRGGQETANSPFPPLSPPRLPPTSSSHLTPSFLLHLAPSMPSGSFIRFSGISFSFSDDGNILHVCAPQQRTSKALKSNGHRHFGFPFLRDLKKNIAH